MKCTKPCFEMKCINENSDEVKFFKELYYIMKKYNVHRIYSASLDKKKIISAQQLLGVTIGNNNFTKSIFKFLDEYMPNVYFHIFYKNHIFRYNIRLKRLFKKYGLEKIVISSFNLHQGIHTTANSLCVREIELVYKDNICSQVESLYLNMEED